MSWANISTTAVMSMFESGAKLHFEILSNLRALDLGGPFWSAWRTLRLIQ